MSAEQFIDFILENEISDKIKKKTVREWKNLLKECNDIQADCTNIKDYERVYVMVSGGVSSIFSLWYALQNCKDVRILYVSDILEPNIESKRKFCVSNVAAFGRLKNGKPIFHPKNKDGLHTLHVKTPKKLNCAHKVPMLCFVANEYLTMIKDDSPIVWGVISSQSDRKLVDRISDFHRRKNIYYDKSIITTFSLVEACNFSESIRRKFPFSYSELSPCALLPPETISNVSCPNSENFENPDVPRITPFQNLCEKCDYCEKYTKEWLQVRGDIPHINYSGWESRHPDLVLEPIEPKQISFHLFIQEILEAKTKKKKREEEKELFRIMQTPIQTPSSFMQEDDDEDLSDNEIQPPLKDTAYGTVENDSDEENSEDDVFRDQSDNEEDIENISDNEEMDIDSTILSDSDDEDVNSIMTTKKRTKPK